LREHETELAELGVAVAVVTFEAGFLARKYVEESGLVWPLLVDEKRELYRGYGMLAASFWDIWGLKTWWAYGKVILHGQRLQQSQGDISQRGGTRAARSACIMWVKGRRIVPRWRNFWKG